MPGRSALCAAAAVFVSAAGFAGWAFASPRAGDLKPCSQLKTKPLRCRKKPKPAPIGRVVARIPLGASVAAVVADGDTPWVVTLDGQLLRVDPVSNSVAFRIATDPGQEFPPSVAFDGSSAWVSNFTDDSVWRIDTANGTVGAKIPVASAPEGIAVTAGAVWVATHHGNPTGSLTRIDPATGAVVKRVPIGAAQDCCGPQGVGATAQAVWAGVPNLDAVVRVDPATNTVAAQVSANQPCGDVVAQPDAVWVGSCSTGLYRIDPVANKLVTTVYLPRHANAIAAGFGAVWVAGSDAAGDGLSLERVNAKTNRDVGSLAVPDAAGVAVASGSVWIGSGRTLLRIKPA